MSGVAKINWDRVYRESELYRAAVRLYTKPLFRPEKALSRSVDGRTLYDFARRGPANLGRLHRQLTGRRFSFRPGLALHRNFNGKRRTLYVYPWEERLVDLLLYRMLNGRLQSWFSPASYAYRIGGWGVDRCQRRVARAVGRNGDPRYVIKRDVTDCFASLRHDILLERLAGLVDPGDHLFALLEQRVKFRFLDDGVLRIADRGVPFGTAVACLLANIYLTEIDRRVTSVPGTTYLRYADDMLVISPDRRSSERAADALDDTMKSLGLSRKASHDRDLLLAPEGAKGEGPFLRAGKFRHLGLDFRADGSIGISRDKGRKIRNLFRFAFRRRRGTFRRWKDPLRRATLAIELARKVLEEGVRNVAIIDYYLRHGEDEEQWRQLDRWLAEEVLHLAFRKGHRKGHFRKLSFGELRRRGLPSLVHRRRLLLHGHLPETFFFWKSRLEFGRSGGKAARSGATATDLPSVPGSSGLSPLVRESDRL